MLTHIDVHYLIGLLTRATNGNDVEIELGDMVQDAASEKERDIDVTVTKKNNYGELEVYRGIEVKDEKLPLDVIRVEQLCQKMSDMPALTHRSIVSASGYTKPAILKAKKHGVDLLEIVNWENTIEGFEPIRTAKENWNLLDSQLVNNVNISFFPENSEKWAILKSAIAKGHPSVCNKSGEAIPNLPNMKVLAEGISNASINKWLASDEGQKMPPNFSANIDLNVEMNVDDKGGKPHVIINSELIALGNAHISGTIQRIETKRNGEFKMLMKIGETIPICCCVIYETIDGHLVGISMSNVDTMSRGLFISYEERLKSKIFKQKLR